MGATNFVSANINSSMTLSTKIAYYTWEPYEDITAYELSLCMPMMFAETHSCPTGVSQLYDKLPDNCKRHWKEAK